MIYDVNMFIKQFREKHPGNCFFDQDTLRFFGERISEMRILEKTKQVRGYSGEEHTCYVLSTLQRNNPDGPTRHYTYFDIDTLDVIMSEDKEIEKPEYWSPSDDKKPEIDPAIFDLDNYF